MTVTVVFPFKLTAEDISNSFELSAEMDSIGSDKKRFSPNRDIASTYFDQRITIPRGQETDVSLC